MREQTNQPTDTPPAPPYPDLTPRQRVAVYLFNGLSNDLGTGTVEEQHTAALLRLCGDAIGRGYAGELVRAMREWAWEMGR